ncbi:MAG: hypothetical protein OXP69_16475 [Spirochaetaceae bacterium]|nr:hypothetical protein [Spirochaetaceae bacterium]
MQGLVELMPPRGVGSVTLQRKVDFVRDLAASGLADAVDSAAVKAALDDAAVSESEPAGKRRRSARIARIATQ